MSNPRNPAGISLFTNIRMPRFWHGMTVTIWLRLLARHGFRIHPSRWAMAAAISLLSVFNSVLGAVEKLCYRRKVAQTRLVEPPLFVLGHWRTGTTLLHELLALDERFTSPTTYQVVAPHHFLVTSWFAPPLLSVFLPSKRVLDNMTFGLDRPQEDEIGLCNLGLESPYLDWAWPNHAPVCEASQVLDELPPAEFQRWKEIFRQFLQRLTVADPRRIVLKSPTHTARVKTLCELFPDAQFVHIVRNPYDVFPSTIQTWKKMQWLNGLQTPHFEQLEEYLFGVYERMYERLERDKQQIDPSRFCEVRYEDLVREPLAVMERIYEHLKLGDFERVRPKLAAYFEAAKEYRRNKHELPEGLAQRITERWSGYFDRYGYERRP